MLPKVSIGRFCCAPFTNVENYRQIVGDELIDEILSLSRDLNGVRVCHINATGFGGGVAELLARHVPLARALGIDADWRLIQGTPEFFTVTKAIHNALQGGEYQLSESDKAIYLHVNRESAKLLEARYDVFVIHDPQPAAFREAAGRSGAKWIWRCHIDSSAPNSEVAGFLLPYLQAYDAAIFTMKEFESSTARAIASADWVARVGSRFRTVRTTHEKCSTTACRRFSTATQAAMATASTRLATSNVRTGGPPEEAARKARQVRIAVGSTAATTRRCLTTSV